MMRKSNLARRPNNQVKAYSFSLKGGLNLVDAPLKIPDGQCFIGTNYELLTREGYRRIEGFERFDGRSLASKASYWILKYDGGVGAGIINEGDLVTGLLSGSTGVALIPQVGTSILGFLVLTNVTGQFTDNEALQVSTITKSFVEGQLSERGAATPEDDTTYIIDAIETQRALSEVVGLADGSGPVRGVNYYNGSLYAFRDSTDQSQCLMWKESPTGWTAVNLGFRLNFTSDGTGVAFVDGEIITGTVSTATATIQRVVLTSGAWGTDAVGYFILNSVTGGPFQSEAATGSGLGSSSISGPETAQQLNAGGRFEFENYNFYASTLTKRMYGVDGVSQGFEFDGSAFVPISTGNVLDAPQHLVINEHHLQYSFPNGSLQNSATALPYVWAGGGADEIGLGDDIVGLKKEVGGAMIAICKSRTFALHGKNTASIPWDLKILSEEAGGIEWTLQRLGTTKYLDDRGFMDVKAVLDFGDFNTSTYSQLIEPLIIQKKKLAISSIIVKEKSQIRIFFSDGTGIIATFNGGKVAGFSTLNYIGSGGLPITVNCTSNSDDALGEENLYFGSSDGYVYKMDSGTSFDGGPISGTLQLTYTNLRSPSYDKQFKKVIIEIDGDNGTEIKYNILLDYSSGRSPASTTYSKTLTAGGALWNTVNWNQFVWASEDITRIESSITGVGRNIAIQVSSVGTYDKPHTLYGVTYHYIMRKLVR